VRRDGGAVVASAWGNGGMSGAVEESAEAESEGAKGKRKGNKGKKQVLLNWG